MTTRSTISNLIEDPSGNPIGGVVVKATVRPSAFFLPDRSEIGSASTVSAPDGTWSLTLDQNANMWPAGTSWIIEEDIPDPSGMPRQWAITVTDQNQTLFQALTNPPSLPPVTAPGIPILVVATALNLSALVSWQVSTPGIPALLYWTVTVVETGAQYQTVDGITPSLVVPGLSGGNTYTFTVTATNLQGTSGPSLPSSPIYIQVSADVTVAPAPTGTFVAAPPVTAFASAIIAPRPVPVFAAAQIAAVAFPAVVDAPAAQAYPQTPQLVASIATFVRFRAAHGIAQSPLALSGVNLNPAAASGLAAAPGPGPGAAATIATVVAGGFGNTPPPGIPPVVAPSPPTNLVAVVLSSVKIKLSWSPPSSTGGAPLTGYSITSSPSSGTTTTGALTFVKRIGGLTPSTAYTFSVTCTNANNLTSTAATVTATTNSTGTAEQSTQRYLAINQASGTNLVAADIGNWDMICCFPTQCDGTGGATTAAALINGGSRLFLYAKGTHSVPSDGVSGAPNDWFLWTGATGTSARLVAASFGTNVYLMNPQSAGWIAFLTQRAKDFVNANPTWSGEFEDVLGTDAINSAVIAPGYPNAGVAAKPQDPTRGGIYTATNWYKDVAKSMAPVYNGLPGAAALTGGRDIVGNGLGGAGTFGFGATGSHLLVTLPLYTVMAESFVRSSKAPVTGWPTAASTQASVQMVAAVAASGVFVGMVKLWVAATTNQINQWQRIAAATTLLGTAGPSTTAINFSFGTSTGAGQQDKGPYPYLGVKLGLPTAAATMTGTVFSRPFDTGLVLYNSTGTAGTYMLPAGTWTDVAAVAWAGGQGPVYSAGPVNVPANTALLLQKS